MAQRYPCHGTTPRGLGSESRTGSVPLARSASELENYPAGVAGAARRMAARPGAVDWVLRTHVQREDGRCEGCGEYPRTWWPCRPVHIAMRADAVRKGLVDESDDDPDTPDCEDWEAQDRAAVVRPARRPADDLAGWAD